jgi:very-short-patch-repair endonuclease
VTSNEAERYRSIRYCLECGEKLYPREMREALAAIKRRSNRKTANKKITRIRFLRSKSKTFRNRPTHSEQYLWDFLRGGQLGVTFYRQKVVHGYVLDFWCPEKQLAVELDGSSHRNRREKDEQRDQILRSHGIRVVHFPASGVYYNMDTLLEAIRDSPGSHR